MKNRIMTMGSLHCVICFRQRQNRSLIDVPELNRINWWTDDCIIGMATRSGRTDADGSGIHDRIPAPISCDDRTVLC